MSENHNRGETARLARMFRVEKLNPLGLAGPTGDSLEEAIESLLNDAVDRVVNTAHTTDFLRAVATEARHQEERWGESHDRFKEPADWFWLVGFLAGKAVHFPEKRLHHIVSSAAALLQWHKAAVAEEKTEEAQAE